MRHSQVTFALLGVCCALFIGAVIAQRTGRRQEGPPGFKSPCGTSEQVSKRVGTCLVEVFELIEGRFVMPKNDEEIVGHCGRFNNTERCARSVAKDCLSGLHKTAASAVASATRRWRLSECKNAQTRSRYFEPLKCAIKNGADMKQLYQTSTGMMQAIRDLNEPAEDKLMRMCCVLNKIDVDIAKIFDRNCPQHTGTVLSIVHAITDDARSTLCVAPKCEHALDKVLKAKYQPSQNFIEPIMQILFQLNV